VYDSFRHAVSDLVDLGPGSLLIKLDLESAFRHIPIRPADWHLLGFTWLEQYFFDIVLGFGCRSAPYIFNLFAEALHWILERHIPAHFCHYLDDFLSIFRPNTPPELVAEALEWMLGLGHQLGLRFQPSKIEGPATYLDFLGIELDSIAIEACLSDIKLQYLWDLVGSWSWRSHCRAREVEELTGYLQFASQVIPYSRAFICSLYDFHSTFPSPFSLHKIPQTVHRDIE